MEHNLKKLWITLLYTWNWHNIVHQQYLNLKKKRRYKQWGCTETQAGCPGHWKEAGRAAVHEERDKRLLDDMVGWYRSSVKVSDMGWTISSKFMCWSQNPQYPECDSIWRESFFLFFFNFTILFCHISIWIRHRYTRAPQPEPSSLLPWGILRQKEACRI